MSGYVIYLSSNTSKGMSHESYGYWRGKTYQVQGETFPVTDIEVTPDTKVYKSKKERRIQQKKYLISVVMLYLGLLKKFKPNR
ncbi:hypothetical protein COJ26_27750 [Bacillus thuringiensis]|uniref:hypothetical protein n=1 Tax=Bacillus thuringiensis TaxID=1428 RepID=UPI000BF3ACF4|nr:hypothetical protein [Bacillus thuringiensis]PFL28092.1 hypothetical protein COJ26_27750 [Bacillus thuringiensis]